MGEFIGDAVPHPFGFFLTSQITGSLVLRDEKGRVLATLGERGDNLSRPVVLSDGRVATRGADCIIRVWDLKPFKSPRVAPSPGDLKPLELRGHGHDGFLSTAVALGDGRLASGDSKTWLRIWDASGNCVQCLRGGSGWMQLLVPFAEGRRLASACMDCTVQIWDITAPKYSPLQTLRGHTNSVFSFTVLPGGRYATGSADRTLRIWDAHTGDCLHVEGLEAPVSNVICVGDRLLAEAKTLHAWILTGNGKGLKPLPIESPPPFGLSSSLVLKEDGLFVGGGRDGTVQIWDLATGRCEALFPGSVSPVTFPICCVDLRPDGTLLFITTNGVFRRWECDFLSRKRCIARCKHLKETLMAATWDPARAGVEWRILQELDT